MVDTVLKSKELKAHAKTQQYKYVYDWKMYSPASTEKEDTIGSFKSEAEAKQAIKKNITWRRPFTKAFSHNYIERRRIPIKKPKK